MAKARKTEHEILENIIEGHFDALEFYLQNPDKNKIKIVIERTA
jgi:hypothetical protein